ncbi:hypothetical protein M059_09020 [Streptococcus mitis 18/56]|uniref:DUF1643 domain-containing protein n=1 Tax=Streptococcus mitis 18/56 TaxID=1340485 RepID=S7YYI2_STRMT|nr:MULTISPECIES: DUF1643 domain-containing protein [Streptococcus]EPR93068.1 hypothetical protein M059_09020 [Streptococcus mitis 18/56]
MAFIGLNPSTADEEANDETIRKCIGYEKRWGYGKLIMANLFAFRSTDPSLLKRVEDPVGPDNDSYIQKCVSESNLVIACWGNHDKLLNLAKVLMDSLPNLVCLKRNKNGTPHHPLYLSKDVTPVTYN